MRISLNFLSTLFICFLFTSNLNAEVFTSVTNGNFNNPNTWDVGGGKVPGEMDDVRIRHQVYIIVHSKKTIKSLSLSNHVTAYSGFEINGTDSLVVLNNVEATSTNNTGKLYLSITDQSTLIVNGDCKFLRVNGNSVDDYLTFKLIEDSKAFIKGSFRFDYLGSGSGESEKEIIINDRALLDVEGQTSFVNSAGDDFNLGMYNLSEAFFRDSVFIILNGTGAEAGITLHDTSSLQILSSVYILNSSTASNDFAKLRVREESSSLYIQDNVYLESQGARVKIEAEGTGGSISIGGDIVMNASAENEASINIIEQGKISLGGDIVRQTSFGKLTMDGDGALIFNGSDPQTIPESKLLNSGSDSLFFKKIILENTSSQPFVLMEDLIVEDSLVLTTGNLKSDSTAMVVLKDGATISGDKTAYIEGPVRKLGSTGGQDITLPIGTDDVYAPITLSGITNSSSVVTVQYLSEPPPFGVETFESTMNHVSGDGHWVVEKNASTGDLDITLTWEDSAESGIIETDDLVVAGWDGTEWVDFGQESAGTVGTGGFVSSSSSEPPPFGVETFTFASTSAMNSLPVELNKFKAIPRSGKVDIEWETESEINSSHFLVERSADGINFEIIDFVKSKGGVSISSRYEIEDLSPSFGWNYYRLKMVDNDDSYEYSPVAAVKLKLDDTILVYPNPVRDVLFIKDTEWIEEEVKVEIFDGNATSVFESVVEINDGQFQIEIEDVRTFPSGFYMVKITGKRGFKFVNFVIAK